MISYTGAADFEVIKVNKIVATHNGWLDVEKERLIKYVLKVYPVTSNDLVLVKFILSFTIEKFCMETRDAHFYLISPRMVEDINHFPGKWIGFWALKCLIIHGKSVLK